MVLGIKLLSVLYGPDRHDFLALKLYLSHETKNWNFSVTINYKIQFLATWHILLSAELESVEETSVPHDKIVDCLTSSIHVAHINDILEKQKSLIHMYSVLLSPEHKWTGILCPSLFAFQIQSPFQVFVSLLRK